MTHFGRNNHRNTLQLSYTCVLRSNQVRYLWCLPVACGTNRTGCELSEFCWSDLSRVLFIFDQLFAIELRHEPDKNEVSGGGIVFRIVVERKRRNEVRCLLVHHVERAVTESTLPAGTWYTPKKTTTVQWKLINK